MKILANQKIKALFCKILLYIIGFSVFFIVFMQLGITLAALYIGIGACVMGFLIIVACYGYFKEQNEVMAAKTHVSNVMMRENYTGCFMK